MEDRLFFLALLDEASLRRLATTMGVKLTDGRLRAPGIARLLARKRSLTIERILVELDGSTLALAAQQLGVDASGGERTIRARLAASVGASSVRALRKRHARAPVDLESLQATLVRIVDGDTIVARLDGKETFVRLRGIDAPESAESDKAEADLDRAKLTPAKLFALGARATMELTRLLAGRAIFLHVQPTPAGPMPYLHHRQHRLLAYVTLDAPDGEDVGRVMLRSGHALVWPRNVVTRRYLHPRSESYVTACNEALTRRPGLWESGLGRLCPATGDSWTLADCKDHCYRRDWRSPEDDVALSTVNASPCVRETS